MASRRILTLVACSAVAATARASPRAEATNGRAVFTGSTVPHATSPTLNPAAIGLTPVTELYVALTSVLQQIAIDRRSLDVSTGALGTGPEVRDLRISPGATLGVIWHPSDRLSLGFEARVPPAEMLPEDQALRYHTLGGGQRNYLATVGVSFRVTGALYVGASLSHDNTFLRLRYARDTALEAGLGPGGIDSDCDGAPCGVEHPAAAEVYDVRARSPWLATSNLRVHVGTAFRVYPDVWIGLGYHTPPGFDIQTSLDGSMSVTRAPRDGGEVLDGESVVYVSYPASVDGEVRARLPGELELHVGGRWEDLSRMRSYDVRGFASTFRANQIPEWTIRARGLHDSFALWGGVEQIDTGEPVRLGGRLGLATSGVDGDRTSPMAIAPTSLTVDGGVQLRVPGATWVVQLNYGLQYYPTVGVTDSAFDPRYRLDCQDSGNDYATIGCKAVREGYALPTAAGDYRKLEHAFRLAFRVSL